MSFWHDLAREKIEEAVRSGAWDDLPGKGQPLHLDDDSGTPEHLRLGNKILRDANMVPQWVEEQRALINQRLQVLALRENLYAQARDIRSRDEETEKQLAQWAGAMQAYNRAVSAFEVKAPRGANKPAMFRVQEELKTFARNFGWHF